MRLRPYSLILLILVLATIASPVTAPFDDQPPFSGTGTVLDVAKSKIVFLVGNSGDVRIDNVAVTATAAATAAAASE